MEKILIVEDNKALSKLFLKKITSELSFDVDVAYSMQEAKLFIAGNNYFAALLDLSLPDALNGEIVDFVLNKGIPSIVLTANADKKTMELITQKNIIDYVSKESVEDINYAISMIDRISKNIEHKVLIVDDSMLVRNNLKKMLNTLLFEIFVAAHGEEALNIIDEHPDIKLVITDYSMPVINGLELTIELRKKYLKNQLGIIAISSNDNEEIALKFLRRGATDFILKPFSKEAFTCRVHNTIEALENIDKIMNLTSRDLLSGAYTRRYFYDTVSEYFAKAIKKNEKFAIAMIGVNTPKNCNRDTIDVIIKKVSMELESHVKNSDLVARFGDKEFCVLVKNISRIEAENLFDKIKLDISKISININNNQNINLSISVGIATDIEDTLEEMIDQADMQLFSA